MAIQAERPRRLFTVDEYHRMAEAGVFGPEERVELTWSPEGRLDGLDRAQRA
jgi:hypothetical protein